MGRLFFLDNLKVFLIILVVIHHAAQPYGPGGEWPVPQEPDLPFLNIIAIGLFLAVTAAFFMGLFFFVSAYFLPASLERKGAGRFLKDRMVRLGIPTLVVVLAVLPAIGFFLHNEDGMPFSSFLGLYFPDRFELGYIWFIASLLLFASVYVAWRHFVREAGGVQKPPIPFPGHAGILLFILAFAAALFSTRIWFPLGEWELWHLMEPARYTGYVILFIAGIAAYRNNWLEAITPQLARPWAVVLGISCGLLFVLYLTFGDDLMLGGLSVQNACVSLWDAFVGTSAIICLIALFQRRFDQGGAARKVLAENVYGVYLVHLPVLLLIQQALVAVVLHPFLKFLVVSVVAVPVCFALSEYAVRRIPYVRYMI